MRSLLLILLALLPLGAQGPSPRISADADGAAEMTLRRGRPLFVNALLSHSQRTGGTEAVVLSPAAGGWIGSIRLVVTNAGGLEQSWPIIPTGKPVSGTLALPPDGRVPMGWYLPSGETEKIFSGSYVLRVVLEIKNSPGWNGKVTSAAVSIQVRDEPAELTGSENRQLGLLRFREAKLTAELPEQSALLRTLLAKWPTDVPLLTAASHFYEDAGAPLMALTYAENAFAAFLDSAAPKQYPPPGLEALRSRLRAQADSVIRNSAAPAGGDAARIPARK